MKGTVYLVGAGPGHEGLFTLRGLECLQKAGCVVYDHLVNDGLLRFTRPDAEWIDVGKVPGHHTFTQEQINRLLAEKAREGHCVVRLKGGDPFVFGRGGEEAVSLARQGIPFEVVPGVTSAVAAGSWAGIPVTQRGMSALMVVASGTTAGGDPLPDLDWPALARLRGTLVFLMAMNTLPRIVQELIQYGKDPATPAAVIRQATTAGQRVVTGPLADISVVARQTGMSNPAVVMIGEVVDLRRDCAWWDSKPLAGQRIMVVGSERVLDTPLGHPLHRLRELGAEVLLRPLIRITTDRQALYDYFQKKRPPSTLVFLSRNAVGAFFEGLRAAGQDIRSLTGKEIVAIGEETARELRMVGIFPDLVPDQYHSKALADRMTTWDRNRPITLITSDKGGRMLEEDLRKKGFVVETVPAYRNQVDLRYRPLVQREISRGINTVVFTSPSAFSAWRELAQAQADLLKKADILVIGPVTRKAIEDQGLQVAFSPEVHTLGGLVEEWLKDRESGIGNRE